LISADTLRTVGHSAGGPIGIAFKLIYGRSELHANRIYLMRKFMGHPKLLRHEFAHNILNLNNVNPPPYHENPLWIKCGSPDWNEPNGRILSWDKIKAEYKGR
jgi:hypothetical protein